MTRSGLAWPPDPVELRRFPTTPAPRPLHRLSEHPSVWWFAGRDDGDAAPSGRFDLVRPLGTCYLAGELEGALLEKTLRRPKQLVPSARLRELFHATVDVTTAWPLADLSARTATRHGVNAEIHTSVDYDKTAAWAAALRAAGHPGLGYRLRSDAALRQLGVGVFGGAGLHRRAPTGMRTTVRPLDLAAATGLLEARGVQVVPIPVDVPVTRPRAPRR